MSEAPEQFRAAIEQAGLTPPEFIITDGKLHRFSSDGRRGDNAGWYVFHTGDIPAGAFGCWRSDISGTWRADIGRELTAEENTALKRKAAEDKQNQEAEKKKRQARARERAAKIWDNASDAPADHPYLARKGVGPHGLKLDHGELVVPMYDSAGVLQNLQRIAADGAKNFLFGGRVRGCHLIIGKPNGALGVCEGFATGATVLEDTGHAVAIAFNGGNLPHVAKDLRGKFPDLPLIVCADDDAGTPGNRTQGGASRRCVSRGSGLWRKSTGAGFRLQ
jgi:putative DNA primase/helicase